VCVCRRETDANTTATFVTFIVETKEKSLLLSEIRWEICKCSKQTITKSPIRARGKIQERFSIQFS
jgi:hypothetical protein